MRLRWLSGRRCRLFLLGEADALTTVSQFIVDQLRRFGWTGLPEIAVVPSGVDLENRSADEGHRGSGEPGGSALRLLSVGVLVWKWKLDGHIRALRCLAGCRHVLKNFEFSIAGAGPLGDDLQTEVARLQLQANVRLLGNVTDMRSQFAEADAYLHFAENEGCSLALLEALSHGLPVIATGKGGNGTVLQGLEGVLLLDGTESEVVELFRQKAVLSGWLQRRVRYVRPSLVSYSWDTVADRYLHIFQQSRRLDKSQ